jgi:hypothetical protein
VHGLVPALHTTSTSIQWGRLAEQAPVNWALVLLATSLPVGSIYFGSDLVAKVLHHSPESADSAKAASAQSVSRQANESPREQTSDQAARSASEQAESAPAQPPESAPVTIAEAPVTKPTETDESAPDPAVRPPRSTVAESAGAAPRRATGRVRSAAKATADRPRPRTDAEALDEARLLTADWSDDQLTAERLRTQLRIGQGRARALRDQLQAERTVQTERVTHNGFAAEPPDGRDEAAPQRQKAPTAASAHAA